MTLVPYLSAILAAAPLTILSSCNAQVAHPKNDITNSAPDSTYQSGEVVPAITNNTWYVFQAKNNDYWFGSDGDGVFRYDGKTTTQFTSKHGLSNDRVRGIQEDGAGNIFVNTLDGVNKFDGLSFTTLAMPASALPMSEWKLQPDDLWFAGPQDTGTVLRYDGTTLHRLKFPETRRGNEELKRFPRDKFPNAIYNPYDVYTIYKDSKGHLWFGTATLGACRFDGKSFDWLYEDHLTNTPNGGSFGIRSIIETEDRTFWFCNTQYRFHVEDSRASDETRTEGQMQYTRTRGVENLPFRVPETYMYFMSIVKGSDDSLWMATYGNGVLRYDGTETTHFPVRDGDRDVTIFSIYKDKAGTLWLGTHEAGVYKFNGKVFEKFEHARSK